MADDSERDVSDAGQQARLAREAESSREIVDVQRLADALDLVDAAIPQVSLRSLPALQERLARGAAWARARMERLR